MKKFLLSLIMMATAAISALAITDGVTYQPVNDIKIVNLWIQDRAHTQNEWGVQPYCNTYARTAVMHDGYIYIRVPMPTPSSKATTRCSRVSFTNWMPQPATW